MEKIKSQINNYTNYEIVRTNMVLLRGHVISTSTVSNLEVKMGSSEVDTRSIPTGSISCVNNSFSILIRLSVGTNYISLYGGDGGRGQLIEEVCLLREDCHHSSDSYVVQPLIVMSDCSEIDRGHEESQFDKIETGLSVVQWYFSEKLYEAGFNRSSFSLRRARIMTVSLAPESIHNMTSTEVWEQLAQKIRGDRTLWSDRVKYVAFLVHPWKREVAFDRSSVFALEPRSAVAAGGLVLVDFKLLLTWPVALDKVFATLQSDSKVPDEASLTPFLSTVGRVFGASLGIVAHEMGHVFDLGHEDGGLMGKDFHRFALTLRPKLKSTLGGQTKRVYLTSGKILEDPVQLSQAFLTLLNYNRWFQSSNDKETDSTQRLNLGSSAICLEKNLIKSGTRLSVIQVREPLTGKAIASWIGTETDCRSTFALSKRLIPRDWTEKTLEVLVQNSSGMVLKQSLDFTTLPEGPTPIKR